MSDAAGKRRWPKILLASFISLAILVLLCAKTGVKVHDVLGSLVRVHPGWLLIAFLVSAVIHILVGAWKWLLILRGIGCDTSYREALFVRVGSDPIHFAMPLKLGEVSNVLYYSQTGKLPFYESASWILFDKALNFLGTIFWLLVGLFLTMAGVAELRWPVLAAGGALVLFLLVPHLRRIAVRAAGVVHVKLGNITRQLLVTFERIRLRRRLGLIALAIGFQLRPIIVLYLLFVAFGPGKFPTRPGWPELLAKGSTVVVASNIPGPQAGIGPRETALVALFGKPQAGPGQTATLISMGILMAVAMFLVPAVIGLPFMGSFVAAISSRKTPPTDEAEAGGIPRVPASPESASDAVGAPRGSQTGKGSASPGGK